MLTSCGDTPETEPASDFAILAQAAEGYATARPGTGLRFPGDHGAHPDYRIEWWYLTANLTDAEGQLYGAQWTLFRTAIRPPEESAGDNPWNSSQVFMAHLGLTSPDGHRSFQRYSRGGAHQGEARAGVSAQPFAAWLDDWELASTGADWLPLRVHARQDDHALMLELASERPLVLQGENGFSQKHPDGGGSYYYSQPFLQAHGELVIDGQTVPVTGQAWLDREWSSQFLQDDQQGWDWFALHLDSGEKLMVFQLRGLETAEHYRHAVLITPDGERQPLTPEKLGLEVLNTSPVAGRSIPTAWQLDLPEINRSLTVEALHENQWMDVDYPYWEGVVRVQSANGAAAGVGYLEMTGYPSVGR